MMATELHKGTGWYTEKFAGFERTLNGESASKVHALRREAISRFTDLGFPTTANEEWRFTNLAPMAKVPFAPVHAPEKEKIDAAGMAPWTFAGLNAVRIVLVDGHFSEELSMLDGIPARVRISSLSSALRSAPDEVLASLGTCLRDDHDAMTALNTAFLQDGVFISVPGKVDVGVPVHILYLSSGRNNPFLSTPRNLVIVGAGSRVSLVETYAGLSENIYLTNAVSEIVLGTGAVVEHDKLQTESIRAYHIGTTFVHQKTGSDYTATSVSLGGSLVRNTVTAVLNGERCVCTLNGLSLGTGRQLVDNHTVIDHASPRCESHELYKSILDGRSKGVFNGKIFVRKDAQKTDAKQTNKTLLLSDDATIDTKPQLEIFADDVKCTHGATVGQLDEEQVFYLRSRGVGTDEARDILTYAFASDIINRVHIEPLREQLEGMIQDRLRDGRVRGDGNSG